MDRGSRARSNATAEGLERGRRAGAGETRAVGPCGVAPFGPALHSRRISDFEGDPQSLQDAYHVEVQVILWDAADVLLVPSSAVYRSGNEWSVFTVRKGKAHSSPIQIGHRGESQWEVIEGLHVGDIVITHPSAGKRGVRVRIHS